MKRAQKEQGFSMLELTIVMAMTVILAAVSVMGYQAAATYLRAAGDLRDINGLVAQAKIEAAAGFTHARVFANLANNSFHLETWNKAAGCWQTVGDNPVRCTAAASPVTLLSLRDTFGFTGVAAPPANTQAALGQAALCDDGKGGTIGNSACIVFNSRGIPITALGANAGNPDGTGAFYITNGQVVYGLTVSASGSIQDWSISTNSGGAWAHQ